MGQAVETVEIAHRMPEPVRVGRGSFDKLKLTLELLWTGIQQATALVLLEPSASYGVLAVAIHPTPRTSNTRFICLS